MPYITEKHFIEIAGEDYDLEDYFEDWKNPTKEEKLAFRLETGHEVVDTLFTNSNFSLGYISLSNTPNKIFSKTIKIKYMLGGI